MENLTADIRDGHSVKLTKQFRDKIIECAKNIKSNDQTFKISTLPEIEGQLKELMSEYVSALQTLEANHNTFMEFIELIETNDDGDGQDEDPTDLGQLESMIKESLERQMNNIPIDEAALAELEKILKKTSPQDEDIEVEEPSEIQIPKDPITQTNIKKAVRSIQCNHVYDSTSIEEFFKQKEKTKSRVPCPVAGCTVKAMKRSDLTPDDEINKLIVG